jgi:hypothetical protein
MTLVEMLPGKIEADYLNGELFWRVRELSLCVFGTEDHYFLILCKADGEVGPPVGLNTIAANISATDVATLITKLEKEVEHARYWITQDALDDILEDPTKITRFYDLWSQKVDPYLYKCGCGHLARSHVKGHGRAESELQALVQHGNAQTEDGLIGKGMPREYGQPSEDARTGYDLAIEQAVDIWIRNGELVTALASKPKF